MNETINFPNNYQYYIGQAIKKMKTGALQEACFNFEKAYELKQDEETNILYTTALYQLGNLKKAKEVADDKQKVYIEDEELASFYANILIETKHFLEADKIIQKNRKSKELAKREKWLVLEEHLEQERILQQAEQIKKEKKVFEEIKKIGTMSFEYQSSIVKKISKWTTSRYLNAAKQILIDENVNEIVKTSILEELVTRQVTETVNLTWFHEKKSLILSHLLSLENNSTVLAVKKKAEEQLGEQDPVLFQVLEQEIMLQFLFLYPYIEEVVTDPTKWVELHVQKLFNNSQENRTTEDSQTIVMRDWMDKLDQKVEHLMR